MSDCNPLAMAALIIGFGIGSASVGCLVSHQAKARCAKAGFPDGRYSIEFGTVCNKPVPLEVKP